MTLAAGTRLGPYEILSPLGAGGMGEVYRARDPKLQRDVAIKVLPESLALDRDAFARFESEALAVASLSHPNILSIFDFGTESGTAYAVMELLEGETLRDRLDAGRIAPKQAVDYGLQIVKGLSAAHEKGVVHRDLKPENLFVSRDGHVKILDFGLAKRVETAAPGSQTSAPTQSGRTEPGTVMGTAGYMSPEQVRGQPVDHRSDIFSFGAVLYEMLSGRRAFKKDTAIDTMAAIVRDEPPELSESGRNVPIALDHVIRHCLEKDRENRFQSARDIAFALSEASGPALATSGAQPAAPRTPAPRSRRWIVPAAVAAVVALAAGAWWAARHRRTPSSAPGGGAAQITLAVLPFQNLGGDPSIDHLRLALPDEVVTTLSYIPTLAIRPFASTQKYAREDADPQAAGRELQVADVLTGHFRKEGDLLRLTLEVVDADSNRVIWHDTMSVPATDAIALREQVASRLRDGLFPLVGAAAGTVAPSTRPKSEEAYDLYLRSKALSSDPDPNRRAIEMLERSVGLDADFAPAVCELGRRYHYEASYASIDSGRRKSVVAQAVAAQEKARALDPNLADATQQLIVYETEQGNLIGAYRHAMDQLRKRPRDAGAHFAAAYVLRYAGLLEDAARECDAALAADPHNARFRSCHLVYERRGDFDRAFAYLRLDPGSNWAMLQEARLRLHQGRPEDAGRLFASAGGADEARLLLKTGTAEERNAAAARVEEYGRLFFDSEGTYSSAVLLAAAHYPAPALRLLRAAVEANYLCFPDGDRDRAFDSIRGDPQFAAIRSDALRRQREFVAKRSAG